MEISAETLVAHQLAYGFLGKVFYEAPTPELIQALADDHLFADWPLETFNENAHDGLTLLGEYVSQWDTAQLRDLKRDYARLFIGPDHLLAPPWESVYRSAEHLMFERQTLEVRQLYRRYGMEVAFKHLEPDDHIGLELRFVAHLSGLALAAMERGEAGYVNEFLQAEAQFLDEHLLQWAPACLERVMDMSETPYYRGAAQLTLGCLAHTASLLIPSRAV